MKEFGLNSVFGIIKFKVNGKTLRGDFDMGNKNKKIIHKFFRLCPVKVRFVLETGEE